MPRSSASGVWSTPSTRSARPHPLAASRRHHRLHQRARLGGRARRVDSHGEVTLRRPDTPAGAADEPSPRRRHPSPSCAAGPIIEPPPVVVPARRCRHVRQRWSGERGGHAQTIGPRPVRGAARSPAMSRGRPVHLRAAQRASRRQVRAAPPSVESALDAAPSAHPSNSPSWPHGAGTAAAPGCGGKQPTRAPTSTSTTSSTHPPRRRTHPFDRLASAFPGSELIDDPDS